MPAARPSRACDSTSSWAFSIAIAAAALTASSSSGSSSSEASCTSAAIWLAAALDRRDGPVVARLGQRHGLSVRVGVGAVLRQPVRDDQLGVAERSAQRRLELGAAQRAERREEPREAAAREPRAQQAREERRGHGDERARREPQQRLRAGAGDQVVEQQRREARQSERAGEAGEERAAARRGGPPPAHPDDADRGRAARHEHPALDPVDRVRDVLVGEREQQVLPVEVGEQEPGELQHTERQRVGGDEGDVEPASPGGRG